MSVSSRQRRTGGTLLLALLGAWLSHTAVYVHLRGAAGLRAELLGSPHLYMLPAAGLILAGTGAALRHWWHLWSGLGHRLVVVRAAIERTWCGGPRPSTSPTPQHGLPPVPRAGRLLSLWFAVAPLQLTLYVLQENLEASGQHQAAPGLSVLWSDHWAATVIHLVTALVLCALAVRLTSGVAQRARRLVLHERLLRWLLRTVCAARRSVSPPLQTPLDRFGRQLWSRPPPLPVRR